MNKARPAIAAVLCAAAGAAFSQTGAAEPAALAAAPSGPAPLSLDAIKRQLFEATLARLNGLLSQSPTGAPETVQVKFIEPDGTDSKGGWGVAYDWKVARNTVHMTDEEDVRKGEPFGFSRMSYQLALAGSHAFASVVNNEDLSTAELSLQLDHADLGKANMDTLAGAAFQTCLLRLAPASADVEERRRQDEEDAQCGRDTGIAKLLDDERTAFLYNLNLHGGLEANQDYTTKRVLFGLDAVLVAQPGEAASRYNLLDLPFRALRRSLSPDSRYHAAFPSLSLSLERLDAKDDASRTALTSRTTFTRASAEAAFQTILASFDEGPLRFNLSYRYFYELSAPREIAAAGMARFHYTKMRLSFPARLLPAIASNDYELFVRYTSGRLPFDPTANDAIEVGISTNIETLAKLLAQ